MDISTILEYSIYAVCFALAMPLLIYSPLIIVWTGFKLGEILYLVPAIIFGLDVSRLEWWTKRK